MKAKHFFERKLKFNLLANLLTYSNYKTKKNFQSSTAREIFQSRMKRKCLGAMKEVCSLLQQHSANYEAVRARTEASVKREFLRQWIFNLNLSQQMQSHYHFQLKCTWLNIFKEAVLLSQIMRQKKHMGADYLIKSRKIKLLSFLREYRYEQVSKRFRRERLQAEVQTNKLRLMFNFFRRYVVTKAKHRFLKTSLLQNYYMNIKNRVLRALQLNVH